MHWKEKKKQKSALHKQGWAFKDTQGQEQIPKKAFIASWKHTYMHGQG